MEEDLDGADKKLKTLNTKNPKGSNKKKDIKDSSFSTNCHKMEEDLDGAYKLKNSQHQKSKRIKQEKISSKQRKARIATLSYYYIESDVLTKTMKHDKFEEIIIINPTIPEKYTINHNFAQTSRSFNIHQNRTNNLNTGQLASRVHLLAMANSRKRVTRRGELKANVKKGALGSFDIFLTKTSVLSSLFIFLI
ncbi:hypothetical protein MTR_0516s0010 [Medicago truncatula]|uniref:Uncharacterized protein n=1 Tax=Medicago truncatula TaxID=3880 RepID=A0A072TF38_MEDTR|nr:hypothetical protein MTR_0516s0010 [Medicago truncatula]